MNFNGSTDNKLIKIFYPGFCHFWEWVELVSAIGFYERRCFVLLVFLRRRLFLVQDIDGATVLLVLEFLQLKLDELVADVAGERGVAGGIRRMVLGIGIFNRR